MKLSITPAAVCVSAILLFCSCGEAIVPTGPDLNVVTDSDIMVYYTEAELNGRVKNYAEVGAIKSAGFRIGTTEDNLDLFVEGTISEGKIHAKAEGLTPGKKYFYRAVAIKGKKEFQAEGYNKFITFPDGAVDLDLPSGLKWGTRNVGADYPTETGRYYAWGEIEDKMYYDWSTYKYYNVSQKSFTKYNKTDGLTELEPEDDVAHVMWGGEWRMPVAGEITELIQYCDRTEVRINGVVGYRFLSKKTMNDENFLFIPISGYKINASLYGSEYFPNENCRYWSSTLYESYPSCEDSYRGQPTLGYAHRSLGLPVRPVCK